ncbi:hypothetical protein LTR08_002292 [Meristemomyces frigidus]|nr:hypothetical protein LTR08_002292 [Meristemomyces frigidus]
MGPVTRKSQSAAGAGIVKNPTRKRAPPVTHTKPTGQWNFTNTNNDDVRDSVEHQEEVERQMAIDGPANVEDAVNPLREMADKVGKEVEAFAVTLDQFLADLPTREDKHVAAIEVVMDFKTIAEDTVRDLQKNHQRERMQQLRKEWTQQAHLSTGSAADRPSQSVPSGALSARRAEEVKELRHWQQEADIWELFRLMLELHYRKDQAALDRELKEVREEKLSKLEQPNRYTTEAQLYARFLIEDDVARERSLIKKWLEQAVDHQASDLPTIMEELETRSGSGRGLWSNGWMNTREKIKGEKRLRTWPSPSDPVQPQIRTSAGNDMLVTTLDPDAPLRQQRALEKPDAFYEKAVWIACWEMLRRGKPWEEVKAWCEQRNESWRAVALHAVDATESLSNSAWRKMCYLASEFGCSNEYEAAVYGLLGGNNKAVEKICRNFDDHVHAYYSTTLLRQFEQYLNKNHPDRVSPLAVRGLVDDYDLSNKDKAQQAFTAFLKKLSQRPNKEEAAEPLKLIESYLLMNDAESLVYTVGQASSDLDTAEGGDQTVIFRLSPPPAIMRPEAQIITNRHALRIVAHMQLITYAIDDQEQLAEYKDAEGNVTASYVQSLRATAQRDLTPIYASRMDRSRYVLTMASVLQDVTESSEQIAMLSLMQNVYSMDVESILIEQLESILEHKLPKATSVSRPLRILEKSEINQIHPGQRIREDFQPRGLEHVETTIVRSLHWFQLLAGHWKSTFLSLSLALRVCLMTGRIDCAREVVRQYPYDVMSRLKSQPALGRSVNVMDTNTLRPNETTEFTTKLEMLKRQSRAYFELEQLVSAVTSLSVWVKHERAYTTQSKPAGPAPSGLRNAKAEMDEAMAPLLTGILRHPVDEREAVDMEHIRRTIMPEIIIAYNTALYTAGPTISRESYIHSMDLSVAIADKTSGLAECFVAAGRMRELVSSFAQTSKLMLVMKANGRQRKANKEGKDLGIWEIGSHVQGAVAETDAEVS